MCSVKIIESGKCGENVNYELTEDGVLTIFGEGEMYCYDDCFESSPFGWKKQQIKKVIVEDKVTSIGDYSFFECSSLTEVIISNEVTKIGAASFKDCTSLISITIPDSVVEIKSSAFCNCLSLVSVSLPVSLTEIECFLFSGCQSLISIVVPNKVKCIYTEAFLGCSALKEVKLPNSLFGIGYSSFQGCISLVSVTIPNSVKIIEKRAFAGCISLFEIVTSKGLTEIGDYAFWKCSLLTSIKLPNTIDNLGNYIFGGCVELKSIISFNVNPVQIEKLGVNFEKCILQVPRGSKKEYENHKTWRKFKKIEEFDSLEIISFGQCGNDVFYELTEDGVLTISGEGDMYNYSHNYGYKKLEIKEIVINEGVTSIGDEAFEDLKNVFCIKMSNSIMKIGELAFAGCTSLLSIVIPQNITNIADGAFARCPNLQRIDVDEHNLKYASVDGVLYDKEITTLFCCPCAKNNILIPNSVTKIGNSAFFNCSFLEAISLSTNILEIENCAFAGCLSLKSIKIPSSVINIGGGVFCNCEALEYVELSENMTSLKHYYDERVAFSGYCGRGVASGFFAGCSSLISVFIPDSITLIGDCAFQGCSSLSIITIPDGVSYIGNRVFEGCSSLTFIKIPNSVINIGGGVFCDCEALESVELSENITSLEEYFLDYFDDCAGFFEKCSSLRSIIIPDSIIKIGNKAFAECISLESIVIPNNIKEIGGGVFYECKKLKTITLSDNITTFKHYIRCGGYCGFFEGCSSLVSITIPKGLVSIQESAIVGCKSLIDIKCLCEQPPKILGYDGEVVKSIMIIDDCIVKVPKGTKQAYMEAWSVEERNIEEFELTSGYCGEKVCYELNDEGVLVISGDGAIYDNFEFGNKSKIKKVVIGEGVTFVSASAFKDCNRLRFVEFASSIEEIGNGAFAGCGNVISIIVKSDLPPIVGSNTFEGMESSVEIVVPASAMRYYKAAKGWNKFTNYVVED